MNTAERRALAIGMSKQAAWNITRAEITGQLEAAAETYSDADVAAIEWMCEHAEVQVPDGPLDGAR